MIASDVGPRYSREQSSLILQPKRNPVSDLRVIGANSAVLRRTVRSGRLHTAR